jgi:hypothetical protein
MSLPGTPWQNRPIEVANLLNPAFTALLIREAAAGHSKDSGLGLPFSLAYFVLPIALHGETRAALPRTTAALLHVWLQEHGVIKEETSRRLVRLKPYTNEAILFGLQHGLLTVGDEGRLGKTRIRLRGPLESDSDPRECRGAAAMVGRWFAKTASTSLIYSLWGIRP